MGNSATGKACNSNYLWDFLEGLVLHGKTGHPREAWRRPARDRQVGMANGSGAPVESVRSMPKDRSSSWFMAGFLVGGIIGLACLAFTTSDHVDTRVLVEKGSFVSTKDNLIGYDNFLFVDAEDNLCRVRYEIWHAYQVGDRVPWICDGGRTVAQHGPGGTQVIR